MPELPATGPTDPAAARARGRTTLTPLQFELARALPALWNKASDAQLTAAQQHKKLLELVAWVAGKQGYSARARYRLQYWEQKVKKDGQLDLAIRDAADNPVLLLEVDWTKNAASLAKLQAASILKVPVMWIVGVPCKTREDAKLLRAFANDAMGKPTGWWLPIFHLQHGWI